MAETQSSHRQRIESRRIDAGNLTERLGQVFAFVITMTAICGGVYLISIDKDATGLTAIVTALMGLVGVFVYGKYTQAKELENKRRPFEERERQDKQLNLFDDHRSVR